MRPTGGATLEKPVQFATSVASLAELGCALLLEVAPQPTLTGMTLRCWQAPTSNSEDTGEPQTIASLRRNPVSRPCDD